MTTRCLLALSASLFVVGCGGSEAEGATSDAAVDTTSGDTGSGDTANVDGSGIDTAHADTSTTDTLADASIAETTPGDGEVGVDALDDGAPIFDDTAPAGGCSTLLNDGPVVTVMDVPADMPTAKGGTIVPGTYHRSAWTRYTGAGGASGPGTQTDRTTAYFTSSAFQIVSSFDGAANLWSTGSYGTSDAGITLARTCPSAFTSPFVAFDATPTTIVLYDPASHSSLTYVRR